MLDEFKVKVGPQFYSYYNGAFDLIPNILNHYKVENLLIVHGEKSWEKAKPRLSFLEGSPYSVYYHQYTGECSYFGADLIKEKVLKHQIDFIIGVGGGKLADLVGYAANISNVEFGMIPTLASNCAPWTPLSVMYKEDGTSEGKSEHYFRQAAFMITEPNLVVDAPVNYFVAGLADTIAKWYESESILAQEQLLDEPFLQMASHAAVICKKTILTHAEQAVSDMEERKVTSEFVALSEIVFGVAGLVGGLGDKYARNAAAHAMHDALGKYVPESHNYLHGEKVAYGIFYQLALEGKWTEIDELLPFYYQLKLPKTLGEMGIFLDEVTLEKIVAFIDSKEKVHLIPIEINSSILKKAIIDLENYIKTN